MKQWRQRARGILVGVVAFCCGPGTAGAVSDVDILMDKLVEKGILTHGEVGLIRREIEETKAARNKELAKEVVPDSASPWQWKGDIRLRNEFRNREATGADTNRQRIRFRYGAEGKVSDNLKVKFRVATGSTTDPVSTNQSFDVNFNKVAVNLDLANLEYAPKVPGMSQVALVGGIMESPFWTVGPLVWDGDLSWHGAALKVMQELGPATLFSNSGVFSLDTDESESSSLWSTQLGASMKPMPDAEGEFLNHLTLTGALAYHDYRNTFIAASNKSGTDPLTRESQNSFGAGGASDFNQLNPSLELATQVAGVPVSLFGDWVRNASAPSLNNDGFQVGLKLGKAKKPWSPTEGWEAGYSFQQLERNAAYDEFVDSDFHDGGTNNRGHIFWVTLATLKRSTVGLKYYLARQLEQVVIADVTAPDGKDHEDRVQFDWVTKF